MDRIAPAGPVYQAGTLSGNPLAMAAGIATLRQLGKAQYDRLEALGSRLQAGLVEAAGVAGAKVQVNRVGSMITVFFFLQPVFDAASARKADTKKFATYFRVMLENGVYLPPPSSRPPSSPSPTPTRTWRRPSPPPGRPSPRRSWPRPHGGPPSIDGTGPDCYTVRPFLRYSQEIPAGQAKRNSDDPGRSRASREGRRRPLEPGLGVPAGRSVHRCIHLAGRLGGTVRAAGWWLDRKVGPEKP